MPKTESRFLFSFEKGFRTKKSEKRELNSEQKGGAREDPFGRRLPGLEVERPHVGVGTGSGPVQGTLVHAPGLDAVGWDGAGEEDGDGRGQLFETRLSQDTWEIGRNRNAEKKDAGKAAKT